MKTASKLMCILLAVFLLTGCTSPVDTTIIALEALKSAPVASDAFIARYDETRAALDEYQTLSGQLDTLGEAGDITSEGDPYEQQLAKGDEYTAKFEQLIYTMNADQLSTIGDKLDADTLLAEKGLPIEAALVVALVNDCIEIAGASLAFAPFAEILKKPAEPEAQDAEGTFAPSMATSMSMTTQVADPALTDDTGSPAFRFATSLFAPLFADYVKSGTDPDASETLSDFVLEANLQLYTQLNGVTAERVAKLLQTDMKQEQYEPIYELLSSGDPAFIQAELWYGRFVTDDNLAQNFSLLWSELDRTGMDEAKLTDTYKAIVELIPDADQTKYKQICSAYSAAYDFYSQNKEAFDFCMDYALSDSGEDAIWYRVGDLSEALHKIIYIRNSKPEKPAILWNDERLATAFGSTAITPVNPEANTALLIIEDNSRCMSKSASEAAFSDLRNQFDTIVAFLQDDSPTPLKFVYEPSEARFAVRYSLTYFNGGRYTSAGHSGSVTGYGSKLSVEVVDLTSGKTVSSVSVKKSPGTTVTISGGFGDFWMGAPDLTDSNAGSFREKIITAVNAAS
jgi:hypothetical protein